MPGSILNTLPILIWSSQQPTKVGIITIPISQMKKQRQEISTSNYPGLTLAV